MMEIKVLAPAKINLMLDVTGKRDDGYHTLTTIMQSVSLADIVEISETDTGKVIVSSDNESISSNQDNIAYKAAVKFINFANIQHNGLNIHIQKNIPSEAGLGGGSADAAAVLAGLNHMYKTDLSLEQLCSIGVSIGADVPFCIVGGTRLCVGIGEIMTETFPLEKCYIVIAKGNTGISTKSAFEKIDAVGFEKKTDYSLYDGSVQSVKNIGYNRFELVADNYDVNFIKSNMLKMNADYSAMTGSGSAVFGFFSSVNQAEKCVCFFKEQDIYAEMCTPFSNGAAVIL